MCFLMVLEDKVQVQVSAVLVSSKTSFLDVQAVTFLDPHAVFALCTAFLVFLCASTFLLFIRTPIRLH